LTFEEHIMLKPSPEGEGFNPTRTCDNKNWGVKKGIHSYLFHFIDPVAHDIR
jgi:hypothetical protein